MYTINQFKPTLYALLLLGMLGFGFAAESAGIWALGTGGILLNAWLVKTRRFTPMPRLLANLVTIGAMLYVAREVFAPGSTAVIVIGKFLVLLQLIKLWEQRANRDYAQLIVLSLLLMVAASINTTSLLFALMLVAYLFLSLYCCLLFHLKVESDSAHAAFALPIERMSPATLRQDKRFLGRSMRRLTGVVSAIGIVTAVTVFLLFPRGAGAGMFGPLQFRQGQALTGFSETVNFQNLARIAQNHTEVANVEVWRDGQPVDGADMLLLRGVTLDKYNRKAGLGAAAWQWGSMSMRNDDVETVRRGQPWRMADPEPSEPVYRQQIQLLPTGTMSLFAMGGVFEISARQRDLKLRFDPADRTLRANEGLTHTIRYEVVSSNAPFPAQLPGPLQLKNAAARRAGIDAAILKYALDPNVSGRDANDAPLARQRLDSGKYVHELDEQIARNIERHLKTSFSYTLDLTDARKLTRDDDPMVSFLYELKRGHCEYFAGAMALICQSLGMQARIVNGFKCDEFNDIGTGYYIVRQSHAHSWVEVQTLRDDEVAVWSTFDPTSSLEEGDGEEGGAWQKVKHLFNFLEFTYANAVIGYDNDNRDNLVASLDAGLQNSTYRSVERLSTARRWLEGNVWSVSTSVLNVIVALMAVALAAFAGWFLWERWMLRRKAARIGLKSLPTAEQLRLARQLGFYDDLMRLLARQGICRPPHLTPLEFSRTLLFLPSEAYDTIRRLTEVFYRVRYGHAELDGRQRRRLEGVISRLEQNMANPPRIGAAGA